MKKSPEIAGAHIRSFRVSYWVRWAITQNWYLITKSVMSLLLTSRRLCNEDKIDSFPEVQVQKEKENCYIIEKKMERNQGRFDIKFAFFQLSEYNFVQSCIMEKEITFFHKGLQVVMSFAYFRGDLHRANVILKMMLGQLSFLSKRLELFLPDVLYSVSLLYWSKSQVPHVKTITSSFKFYFQNTFSSFFLSILFYFFFHFFEAQPMQNPQTKGFKCQSTPVCVINLFLYSSTINKNVLKWQ